MSNLKITRPLFTLRFEPVRSTDENKRRLTVAYKMFVEDIKYRRGAGHIETFNGVSFKSSAFIDPKDILAGLCYLPGEHTNRQEWTFISKKQLDKLKGKEVPRKRQFKIGNNVTSCKESACIYIINSKARNFDIEFELADAQIARLKKLAPHSIEAEGNKITVDEWWLTYKRIGWLLLATRLVAGDYWFKTPLIKKKFFDFSKGVEDNIDMTYSLNWQHFYEKVV